MEVIKAFKGFNRDMTCTPTKDIKFQYEEGKEYEENGAVACEKGFHACEYPLDILGYYYPNKSVYHEVELSGTIDKSENDKTCASKIKIGAEISIAGLVKAAIEYTKSRTTTEHTDPELATAGNRGAATAGEYGAATAGRYGAATAGEYGAATAGEYGAATAQGSASSGKNGLSVARGNGVKEKGGLGAILVIAEENEYDYDIKDYKVAVVDGEKIKADTWYELEEGELVEVEE